jgi:hypothetical protein
MPPPLPAFAAPRSAPVPPVPPKPETQWHYSSGGRPLGPVPESVLRGVLQSLPPDTLVWHTGLPGWKTAAEAGLWAPAAPKHPPTAPSPAYAPQPAFNPPPAAFRPSPPPSAPPTPGFQPPPAYGPPSFGAAAAPAAVPTPGSPMPPDLHWAVVMVLAWVTVGLAGLVWFFKQAAFVKKIDPSSKAMLLLAVTLIGMVAQVVLAFGAMRSASASSISAIGGLVMILNLVIVVTGLVTVFSMRSSIQRYYNSVEPIGLRLSGVMTFFFSILYFQYHFSRIAAWKKTGRLS